MPIVVTSAPLSFNFILQIDLSLHKSESCFINQYSFQTSFDLLSALTKLFSRHLRTLFCLVVLEDVSSFVIDIESCHCSRMKEVNFHWESNICWALGMYGRVATYTLQSFSTWHSYFLVCTVEETAVPILEEFVNYSPAARGLQILLVFDQHPAWFISL